MTLFTFKNQTKKVMELVNPETDQTITVHPDSTAYAHTNITVKCNNRPVCKFNGTWTTVDGNPFTAKITNDKTVLELC